MKKQPEEQEEGVADWIVSYGDMMSLLLCFFILLFSFSTIDAQKWKELVASLRGEPAIVEMVEQSDPSIIDIMPDDSVLDMPAEATQEPDSEELYEPTPTPTGEPYEQHEALFDNLYQEILESTREAGMDSQLEVLKTETEIILRFYNNLMFASGSADLNARSKEVIASITPIIVRYEADIRMIRIEGNTDDVPICNSRFRDNYELSAQRALVVLRYIRDIADFPATKMMFTGYGEFYPIADNDTEEGRALNRRTDIVLVGVVDDTGPDITFYG